MRAAEANDVDAPAVVFAYRCDDLLDLLQADADGPAGAAALEGFFEQRASGVMPTM